MTKSVSVLLPDESPDNDSLERFENWNCFGSDKKNGGWCPQSAYLEAIEEKEGKNYYYRKVVPCGKEICPVCGQKGSLLHRQRFGRGVNKILGAKALGYFVFTFPPEVRREMASKVKLHKFTDYIHGVLACYPWRIGAVSRWHWGGDKNSGWHPHLNILVNMESGWLDKEVIDEIREKARLWICDNLQNVNMVVVDYSYAENKGKKLHWWSYLVRPTLLLCGEDIYQLELQGVLHNFRNTRWRGRWDKYESIQVDEGKRILNDITIRWSYQGSFDKVLDETLNCRSSWEYLGYGIFVNSS